MWWQLYCLFIVPNVISLNPDLINLASDYFMYKDVKDISYFSCDNYHNNLLVLQKFNKQNCHMSVHYISTVTDVRKILQQRTVLGVLVDGSCDNADLLLYEASKNKLYDMVHSWLILTNSSDHENYTFIHNTFDALNLSIDADIAVVTNNGGSVSIADVYNFGKIQGNRLEVSLLGSWSDVTGIQINQKDYKYYNRWDFHNLTLRAISVIVEKPDVFYPEMLSEMTYTAGVAAMTKITSQLLNTLRDQHNFRFNYTIAGRWIGSPIRNSTLAVTNSLFWGEQDLSSTCARIFPKWLDWVDIYHPPTTNMQTKFYYLMLEKGVGDYQNRFLTPLSPGVWCCAFFAGIACTLVLATAAAMESRERAGLYAFFSVFAAVCQQAYEDGTQILENAFSSQGRRLTLLVIGLTSMLLYNYYTSSVVSWLLNAAAPSISNLDGLINSDLELVFEDIGYARGWLDNPGFYYYSGFKNVKEDELRDKVIKTKRTISVLQSVNDGVELVRSGRYAFHTEPYTASQVVSKTFVDEELCNLGSLQMMLPAHVYIMAQKHSPYKEFFDWSLLRLLERGHFHAIRARFAGTMPACSGRRPRALALGQAAPAFVMLFLMMVLSWLILALEVVWNRAQRKKRG